MLPTNRSATGSLHDIFEIEQYLLSNGYKRHTQNVTKIDKNKAIGISWSYNEYWFFVTKTSKPSINKNIIKNIINKKNDWWFQNT